LDIINDVIINDVIINDVITNDVIKLLLTAGSNND